MTTLAGFANPRYYADDPTDAAGSHDYANHFNLHQYSGRRRAFQRTPKINAPIGDLRLTECTD